MNNFDFEKFGEDLFESLGSYIPVNSDSILRRLGIFTVFRDEISTISDSKFCLTNAGVIFYELPSILLSDTKNRSLYETLILYSFKYVYNLDDGNLTSYKPWLSVDTSEEAFYFARCILLPKTIFLNYQAFYKDDEDMLDKLSRTFHVSENTVIKRMEDLNIYKPRKRGRGLK